MIDELEPWEERYEDVQPDEAMTPLEQLKKYQYVIRKIMPLCDAYEAAVLIQILDRTIGWRKHKAAFTPRSFYGGDRLYGGLSRLMHRSKFFAAINSLQERGVINREEIAQSPRRVFSINFDVDLERLTASAKPKSASANRRAAPE